MKEHPILFSGPMVCAILEGRKTQTRRIMKSKWFELSDRHGHLRYNEYDPPSYHPGCDTEDGRYFAGSGPFDPKDTECQRHACTFCSYGQAGDRLWVRETFCDLRGGGFGKPCAYRADSLNGNGQENGDAAKVRTDYGYKWKPSIFMPRWASRITLEITDVRVEPLQDISDDDVDAEGLAGDEPHHPKCSGIAPYEPDPARQPTYCPMVCGQWSIQEHFGFKWDVINGKRALWASNPWVWAITFKRINP